MGENTINIDGQPISIDHTDTVNDLKYKAGVDNEDIVWGKVDGELVPLNDDDPVELIEDNEATTLPGGEGQYYG